MIIVNYFYLSKANLIKLEVREFLIVNFTDFTFLFGKY